LTPQAIIFLGDLFDGGREWDTSRTVDKPKGHGQGERAHFNDPFWHKEYERFLRIFPNEPGVLTIKTIPGNHDLGFGRGVKPAVYERFRTYFGETNSVWEIGNHSFVLLDTVSLSDDRQDADGWKVGGKAKEWLSDYSKGHHQPIPRTTKPRELMPHWIQNAYDFEPGDGVRPPPQQNLFERKLPTLLFTHVPLYRAPGVDCGTLRESRKAGGGIPIHAGYQYSNVLSHELSRELLQTVSPLFVFSGDDHDYCVVEHAGVGNPGKGVLRTGRWGLVKEVTVKSFSWAMGIRRPGLVLISLYNPTDEDGGGEKLAFRKKNKEQAPETEIGPTLQTHLCLLPDQIGIFIRYAIFFIICFTFFFIKSITQVSLGHGNLSNGHVYLDKSNSSAYQDSILPLASTQTHTTVSHAALGPNTLKGRPTSSVSSNSNSRSTSPRGGYGYYDKSENTSHSSEEDESDKYNKPQEFGQAAKNWLASTSYASSPAAIAAAKSADEAKEKLLGDAKKFVAEKKFAAQKLLQSSQLGRQVVKGWRQGEGRVRGGRIGRLFFRIWIVLYGTLSCLYDVAFFVIPFYICLLVR